MKYARIIAEFYSRPWAIKEETLIAMQELLRLQGDGIKWTVEEIRQRIAASNAANGFVARDSGEARWLTAEGKLVGFDYFASAPMEAAGKRNSAAPGSVALIPITGIISHRMSMMGDISGPGGTSTTRVAGQFRQALEDGNCKAIVFDVDSPGGSVEGVTELASEIFKARKQKPITAVCNSMACSAAYWIASAAEELVCTPSGQCGSIGVFMLLQDESEALAKEGIKINLIKSGKYKAEGHPSQPLSDDARAFLQSQCDSVYSMFVKAVAQNRKTAQATVREGYGEGRSLLATDAVKAGLADRVATLDDVLASYGVKTGAQASAGETPIEAADTTHTTDITDATPIMSAAKPGEDDEQDPGCGCNGGNPCAACQGCTATGARADDDMACKCSCSACQACAYKGGAVAAAARRRTIQLL
jgi:capsid assembly protease